MADALTTLDHEAYAEYTEKKSVFIGYAAPVYSVREAEDFVRKIRQKYANARHHVFAYLVGNDVRFSDDGEPKGTGGLPVLSVLKKSGVDGAVLVVTRYFGGILLGAPGLLRAYAKSAAMAVEAAGIVTYRAYTECTVTCDYSIYDRLLYEIGHRDILTDGTDFGSAITMHLAVLNGEYEAFSAVVNAISCGKTKLRRGTERFDAGKSGKIE